MITLAQIQEKLSEAIEKSGKTQKEIAKRIGVSRSQISCYLHNKKMPALDTFANLCKVLDVSADDILCIDD